MNKEREQRLKDYRPKRLGAWRNKKPRTGGPAYCERTPWFTRGKPTTHVCIVCHFTMKRAGKNCPRCHHENSVKSVGLTARPPKTNQRGKWKKFWQLFDKGSHPKGCR